MFRFRLVGSRFVRVAGWQLVAAGIECAQTGGAVEGALALPGAANVAMVSLGVDASFKIAFAFAGLSGGGGGGAGMFALLLLVFLDGGQVEQEEAQFAGGGDGLAVLVGFGAGLVEAVDLVGELVGGDGLEDV